MTLPFFSRLSYSFGNEDWRTEREALCLQPSDRAVCITASGDRALHLLLDECQEVVSVDLNPIQNHLLHLKMAALQHLDYEGYLKFLGAEKASRRTDTLKHLPLPAQAAKFWNQNHRMIDKGVLYQGAVERVSSTLAFLVSIFRRNKIQKLFSFDDIEEQKRFVEKHWDTYYWRAFFKILLHPSLSRIWMKDPGLYEYVDTDQHPGDYIYTRMRDCLLKSLAKENLLLSFLFLGKVDKPAFPPYLTQEGSQEIQKRLNKITVKESNIVDFLEKEPESSYDAFSISDVASYISDKDFYRLIKAIHRAGRPGARFCLRQFLTSRRLPADYEKHLVRDPALEQRLEKDDRMFVYKFLVGKVEK